MNTVTASSNHIHSILQNSYEQGRKEEITSLTPAQSQIVELLAADMSLKDAAYLLQIAYGTAKNYLFDARRAVSEEPVTTARLVALWVTEYGLPKRK